MCGRVVEGLGGGLTFPAMNVVMAAWAPPLERCIGSLSPSSPRSTMSSIAFSGASLGTVLSMLARCPHLPPPASGLTLQVLGWQWVFYLQGGLATLWVVLWAALAADTPDTHRWVGRVVET